MKISFFKDWPRPGKYVAAIAAEMTRSEAAIRSHAALLNLRLAKGQRGPKANE
jgi:hypothetical protein